MKIELIPSIIKIKFIKLLKPIIRFFVKCRLNPNHLTTISLIICVIAAFLFAGGFLTLGAVLLLLGGLFDMIDGAVARAANRVTRFGALYDSTLDRYAEIIIFFGIGYYYVNKLGQGSDSGLLISMAVFIGLAGSIMVSYVRARAEGLGFECKVGIMQRPERLILLSIGALISDKWLVIMIILVAVLSNVTAIQRIIHIWLAENSSKWKKLPTDVDHE